VTYPASTRGPKYQRIADELRREIKTGALAPGDRLPAESALTTRFRVSLPTLRQAIGVLRSEGLVEARHGIGTFVKDQTRLQRRSRRRYGRARGDQKLLTSHLRHEITFAGRATVPEHIAPAMHLDPGSEVVVRRRVLHDKESDRVEEIGASYLPVEFAGGTFVEKPTVVPKALFLCMEDLSGRKYSYARDQWIARMPTSEEMDELGLTQGAPIIHVVHAASADDGTILEVSESIWPADRITILDEYPITTEAEEDREASDV
jgi:DNA-binding GntR family transcriptional regulator